ANCLAFSPDGKLLVSGGADGQLIVWDPFTGVAKRHGRAHTAGVKSLAFSPDGRQLLTCGDHTVKLWEFASGQLRYQYDGHIAEVKCVAFSPDGRRAVSGSEDTTAMVWDMRPPVAGALDLDACWG